MSSPNRQIKLAKVALCRLIQISLINLQPRQPVHNLHRLKAHGDHPLKHFQRVARVADCFVGVIVCIVDDAAFLVGFDDLAFHHPFQCGFAVDDVVISLKRDVLHRDVVVIDHGGQVFFPALSAPFPLGRVFDTVEGDGIILRLGDQAVVALFERDHVRLNAFKVHMQIAKGAACVAEGGEVIKALDRRNARELFGEVVFEPRAILGRVQQAIDVVEQILFADLLSRIGGLKMRKPIIGDGIATGQTRFRVVIGKETVIWLGLFIEIEGEALSSAV